MSVKTHRVFQKRWPVLARKRLDFLLRALQDLTLPPTAPQRGEAWRRRMGDVEQKGGLLMPICESSSDAGCKNDPVHLDLGSKIRISQECKPRDPQRSSWVPSTQLSGRTSPIHTAPAGPWCWLASSPQPSELPQELDPTVLCCYQLTDIQG